MHSSRSVFIILMFASLILLEIFTLVKFIGSENKTSGLNPDLCKCKNLNNSVMQGRILNGTAVDKEDLKWVGSLFEDYFNTSQNIRIMKHVCTTFVINEKFFLTAAHCLAVTTNHSKPILSDKNIHSVAVNSGHSMTEAYFDSSSRKKVRNFFIHPLYEEVYVKDESYAIHDIGVVEVDEPFILGDNILPACLIGHGYRKFEDKFIAAGYGLNGENDIVLDIDGIKIDLIIQLNMAIYNESSNCNQPKVDLNFNSTKICAFPQFTRFLYLGDSGGPLHYPISDSLFVVGITSTLESPQRTVVFTSIQYYLKWIDETIGTNRCLS